MWNNVRLMNLISNGMLILAGVIIAQLVFLLAASSPRFALSKASVHGALEHVTREQVSEAVSGRPLGNFFSVDLGQVKYLVERIDWVRSADVRRQWPDRLEILIEEHRVLARWGDRKLINVHGEIFSAPAPANLPLLHGPVGSEAEVAKRYYRYRELVKPLDAELTEVVLSQRYAWTLRLANGVTAELGRDQVNSSVDMRLQRFVMAQEVASERLGRKVTHADLRYPNGFAVRISGLAGGAPRVAGGGKKG